MGVQTLTGRTKWAPGPGARIDWSHYLAKNLTFCWLASSPTKDLSSGYKASSGIAPLYNTSKGIGIKAVTTSEFYSFPLGKHPSSTPWTVIVVHRYESGVGGKLFTVNGGALDRPQALVAVTSTTSISSGCGGSPFTTYAASPSSPTVGVHVVASTWSGNGSSSAGTVNSWEDGLLKATVTGTSGIQSPTSIEVGRYNSTFNQQYANPIISVLMYSYVLSDSAIRDISADPFKIFIDPAQQILSYGLTESASSALPNTAGFKLPPYINKFPYDRKTLYGA